MIYKIFHSADWHVLIRGKHKSKKVSTEAMLDRLISVAADFRPNLSIIPGDLFDIAETTSDERDMVIDKLVKLHKKTGAPIIITPGNHDIIQTNFDYDAGDGGRTERIIDLKELLTRPGLTDIHYMDETGVFDIGAVMIANWSHQSKYTNERMEYNPWLGYQRVPGKFYIDLFHDPIKECLGWDDQILKGRVSKRISVNDFKGDLGLFGDIHRPGVYINEQGSKFTYPSSPMVCNYGEGDYYTGLSIKQQGNSRHGVNLVTIDLSTNKLVSIDFVALKQYTAYHTFNIDELPTLEQVNEFVLTNPGDTNLVRIRFNVTGASAIEVLQQLVSRLNAQHVLAGTPEVSYGAFDVNKSDILSDAKLDSSKLQSKEFLQTLLAEYVKLTLTPAKIPDEERRTKLSNSLIDLLNKQLDDINLEHYQEQPKMLSLEAENFISIHKISIDFTNLPKVVKINGNNGTGKSNIIAALLWLTNGKIDAAQKDNQKRNNRLDLFNDKLDLDTMLVRGNFDVNGEIIQIERKVERSWSDESLRGTTNWRDGVSGVTETISVTVDGITKTDSDAQDLVHRLFGDFYEFVELHNITQASLTSIMTKSSVDLVSWILWHIGLDAFNQLGDSARVKSVKASLFNGLTKPGKNLETLEVEVDDATTILNTENKEFGNIGARLDAAKAEYNNAQIKVDQLQSQLINFTDSDYTLMQLPIQNLQTSLVSEQQNYNAALQQMTQQSNRIQQLQPEQISAQTSFNHIINQIEELARQRASDESSIARLTDERNRYRAVIENIETENKNAIDNAVQQLQSSISTAKSQIENSQLRFDQKRKEAIDELNSAMNQEKQSLLNKINLHTNKQIALIAENNNITSRKNTATEELASLENATCPACGQSIKDSSELSTKIDEKRKLITSLQSQIDENNSSIELEHAVQIDSHKEHITAIESKMMSFSKWQEYVKQELPFAIELESQSKTDVDALKQQITDCSTKIESLKSFTGLLSAFAKKSSDSSKAIEVINADIESAQQRLLALGSVETLQQNKIAASEKLQTITSDLMQSQSLHKTAQADHDTHKQKVISLEYQLARHQELSVQHKRNLEIEQSLTSDKIELNRSKERVDSLQDLKTEGATKLANARNALATAEESRKQLLLWMEKEELEKSYVHAVSKKGIMKQLFDHVSNLLNTKLATLLEDTNFRVFFDTHSDYELRMLDLIGRQSNRPIYLSSGMEKILPALSIVATIKSLKPRRNLDWMFIDEITGQINNGEETTGSNQMNKDYQEIMFKLIQAISDMSKIAIIDHVLNIEWFTSRIEISKNAEGCTTIEQITTQQAE